MSISTGVANPNDYNIGRGILYFASVDSSGFPKEFRDLGNATDFTLNLESENIEHQSSRQGLRVTDREVVVSQSMGVGFTLDEINFDNLALFVSGETNTYTQSAIDFSSGGGTPGNDNVVLSGFGRWYDLYDSADLSSAGYPPQTPATIKRAYNLTDNANAVVNIAGGAALDAADYTFDFTMGRLFIRSSPTTGALTATSSLDVFFEAASTEIDEVFALTQSSVSGALKFISNNAANSSKKTEYQFHSVTLSPEGDFALIGDEFSTMQFNGSAEAREVVDPDSPTLRIRTFTQ